MTYSLLTILLLPSLLMVSLSFSSMAIGLVIASCIVLGITVIKGGSITINKFYLLFAVLGSAWFFANPYVINNGEQERQVFSLIAILLCGAAITSAINFRNGELYDSIKILFWTLLLVGSLGASGLFKPGNYQLLSKAATPFAEPSHFALIFIPIAGAYVFTSSNKRRLFACLASFLLSIWLQNLTLLIGAILISIVALNVRQMMVFLVFFLALSIVILAVDPSHLDYYISRVINSDDDNISRLVYIQGWESMISAIKFTNGLGVGFQNFGVEPSGQAAELLDAILGSPINRADGGFLAAKLVGEFGVVGVVITLFMVILSIRSGIALRRFIHHGRTYRKSDTVSLCFTYSIILELFFRGVGYFSPSFLIFFFFVPKAMRILGKNSKKANNNESFQSINAI